MRQRAFTSNISQTYKTGSSPGAHATAVGGFMLKPPASLLHKQEWNSFLITHLLFPRAIRNPISPHPAIYRPAE